MTQMERIKNLLRGVCTVALSAVIVIFPEDGITVISAIIFFSFFAMGYNELKYYFKMSRFMVGGRSSLYRGIIYLDLAAFTISLQNIPSVYIVLYLMGIHAFSGVIDILRAREAMQLETPAWKNSLLLGIGNITMAVLVVVFGIIRHNDSAISYIYGAGLLYSGLVRIINAFRRTSIVYIQ